jgi:hypothetical protein
MALARTPPTDAISNLAQWAELAKIHDVPGWLRDRAAAAIAYQWAKRVVTTASIAIMCGLIVYFRTSPAPAPLAPAPATTQSLRAQLPPIPFSDDEVHGWLKPANYPTPPNGCDGSIGEDAIKILIGDNGIARTGYGSIIALRIGVCDALSIERSPEGVFVDAELNDGSGSPPVRIKKNEIFAQNGGNCSL